MEDIFDGSVLENITVGKSYVSVQDAIDALEKAGVYEWVNHLPDGLNTNLISGGKGLPRSVVLKLILARCIAKKPSLIVLNDFFSSLSKPDKIDLMKMLTSNKDRWTLIAVSNDPLIMSACDRVIVLDSGKLKAEGAYPELLKNNVLTEFIA